MNIYRLFKVKSVNVPIYINSTLQSTISILNRPFCTDTDKLLKYLDKNSEYRIFPFNSRSQEKISVKEIGSNKTIITSLLSAMSNEKLIGNEETKTITLSADNITQDEWDCLVPLFSSIRIYYYIGNFSSYTQENWVLVKLKSKDFTTRKFKGTTYSVLVEIELPKQYGITLL